MIGSLITVFRVLPIARLHPEQPNNQLVAWGASVGGHPYHRIDDRYEDLKEMGHDVDNPAGV